MKLRKGNVFTLVCTPPPFEQNHRQLGLKLLIDLSPNNITGDMEAKQSLRNRCGDLNHASEISQYFHF